MQLQDVPVQESPVGPRTPSPPGDEPSHKAAPKSTTLEAATHEALQTAAEDLETFSADPDISVFAAYGANRGPSFSTGASSSQLQRLPTPNYPQTQHRTASNQSSATSGRLSANPSRHISPSLSRRCSTKHRTAGVRLQPSATLQRMETGNAWWELKGAASVSWQAQIVGSFRGVVSSWTCNIVRASNHGRCMAGSALIS